MPARTETTSLWSAGPPDHAPHRRSPTIPDVLMFPPQTSAHHSAGTTQPAWPVTIGKYTVTHSDQVVLWAEFTAKPDSVDELESRLEQFAQVVRAEPGNVQFDIYRRAEAPERFFVFEIYRDQTAFDTHLQAATGAEFNAVLAELIVETGSELSFLRPVAHP